MWVECCLFTSLWVMVSKTVVPPPHILYLTLALTPAPQRCVVLKTDLAWAPPQRYNNRQWSADPTLEASCLLLKHSLFTWHGMRRESWWNKIWVLKCWEAICCWAIVSQSVRQQQAHPYLSPSFLTSVHQSWLEPVYWFYSLTHHRHKHNLMSVVG